MSSVRIDILDPKATKVLKDLEDMKLIAIQEVPSSGFEAILQKLRAKKKALSLDDISKEVEAVRSERYGKGA